MGAVTSSPVRKRHHNHHLHQHHHQFHPHRPFLDHGRTASRRSSSLLESDMSLSTTSSVTSSEISSRGSSIDHESIHEFESSPSVSYMDYMSNEELTLVQSSWQAVNSDSSNICLNFFLQLKKLTPRGQGRLGSRNSTSSPLSQSPGGSSSGLLSGNSIFSSSKQLPQGDLLFYALRLGVCIDRLFFYMRSRNYQSQARRNSNTYVLDDTGELQEFLGLHAIQPKILDDMISTFIDTLRLAITHLKSEWANARTIWSSEYDNAWRKFLSILIDILRHAY